MKLFGKGRKTNISSLLNIAGLAAAFAALYIILVQVNHDFSFNRGIRDSDRIYMIAIKSWYNSDRYMSWLNRPLGEGAVSDIAGVEAGGTAALFGLGGEVSLGEEQRMATRVSEMSDGARRMLGIEAVAGSWDDWTGDSTYAISETAARKLGLQVGDPFKIRVDTGMAAVGVPYDATVAVIYKDLPANSDLTSFEMFTNIGDRSIDNNGEWSFNYFVKLERGVSAEDFERTARQKMRDLITSVYGGCDDEDLETLSLHLIGIRDIYFDRNVDTVTAQGNAATTWTLLGIAILVVLIAFINYVNFFFAQIPVRLREVNTRKIFGCSRSRLVLSLVGESVTMVTFALVLSSVAVAAFGNTQWASLVDAPSAIAANPWIAALTALLGVAMSVAASLYPALYITSFNTAFALKGSLGSAGRGKAFRTALVGFQFAISITLIICALFIRLQREYMLHRDMGFDKEQVWSTAVTWSAAASRDAIESRLRSDAAVKDVTWADGNMISDSRMGWGRQINDRECHWLCYPVAPNFLRFMGIEVVEGRDFTDADRQSENGVYIFNEKARDEFGIEAGMLVAGHRDDPAEVAGICRNFNYSALRNSIGPFSFYILGKYEWRPLAQLFVRTEAGVDPAAFVGRLKRVLHEFEPRIAPDDFDIRLIDDTLQAHYTREKNFSMQITLFTMLAIIISLMGVFGLVMFETEYRRKEIGIRRVNGATITEILKMFNSRFVKIVAICFVVAVPVSWWIVNRYLESFAYRSPIRLWVFLAALLAVLAVTVAVVTMRSWSAATENPVKSLKNE